MIDTSSLKDLAKALRGVPVRLSQAVAEAAAPVLTELANETFDRSQDAYGNAWTPGAEGQTVTLEETGRLKREIRYVAIGTKLRVALGAPYAKFQIGRRPVFPRYGALPKRYSDALSKIVVTEATDLVKGRAA